MIVINIIFFFSSRRRHTRSKRDWSSDVCSSDLPGRRSRREWRRPPVSRHGPALPSWRQPRSEERRVGKECRARWWPYHYRKKKRDTKREPHNKKTKQNTKLKTQKKPEK